MEQSRQAGRNREGLGWRVEDLQGSPGEDHPARGHDFRQRLRNLPHRGDNPSQHRPFSSSGFALSTVERENQKDSRNRENDRPHLSLVVLDAVSLIKNDQGR